MNGRNEEYKKMCIVIFNNRILWLTSPGENDIFWDVNSFRPDMNEALEGSKFCNVKVFFGKENLPSGAVIKFPRKLVIQPKGHKASETFVNVR